MKKQLIKYITIPTHKSCDYKLSSIKYYLNSPYRIRQNKRK